MCDACTGHLSNGRVRDGTLHAKQHYSYTVVTHIKTDAAGEWRDDNEEWNTRIGEGSDLGVQMEYPPPERHESMGLAENAC